MWNSAKSVKLSTIFTKIIMVLVVLFAVALPIAVRQTSLAEMFMITDKESPYIFLIIYLSCIMALVALFMLDRLLTNIKNQIIFVEKNVKILRTISQCCFLVAVILIPGSFSTMTFLLLSVMAGFVGLILRVVKNVFEAAVSLKTENDFTI